MSKLLEFAEAEDAQAEEGYADIFLETADDKDFGDVDVGDDGDISMSSSSEDEDEDTKDEEAGEKELQKQDEAGRGKKRKKETMFQQAMRAKKVKYTPTTRTKQSQALRPKKKSERVSWLPTEEEGPTRTSERRLAIANKVATHDRLKQSEKKRLKTVAMMHAAEERKRASRPKVLTQEERLAQAAEVERLNSRSLNRWEEAERKRLEDQNARLEALKNRKLEGPVVTYWSGPAIWVNDKLKHVGKGPMVEEVHTGHDSEAQDHDHNIKTEPGNVESTVTATVVLDDLPTTQVAFTDKTPNSGVAHLEPPVNTTMISDEPPTAPVNPTDETPTPSVKAPDPPVTQVASTDTTPAPKVQAPESTQLQATSTDDTPVLNVKAPVPPDAEIISTDITPTLDVTAPEPSAPERSAPDVTAPEPSAPVPSAQPQDSPADQLSFLDGIEYWASLPAEIKHPTAEPSAHSNPDPALSLDGHSTPLLPGSASAPLIVSPQPVLKTLASRTLITLSSFPNLTSSHNARDREHDTPPISSRASRIWTSDRDALLRTLFSVPSPQPINSLAPFDPDANIDPYDPIPVGTPAPRVSTSSRYVSKRSVLCAITGHVARYRDPLTGLPYASSAAYKSIRRVLAGKGVWSGLLQAWVGDSRPALNVPKEISKVEGPSSEESATVASAVEKNV
jgi:vacuolar protein sorting-associated protein 72